MEYINVLDPKTHPISDIIKQEDLIYFDGALLSLYSNDNNDYFLYYWIDCDEKYNRWLIIPTPIDDLNAYLTGDLSLYSVINNRQSVYMVDLHDESEIENLLSIETKYLPDEYFPNEYSYYNGKNIILLNENTNFNK